MSSVVIRIPGEPVGKGRPRVVHNASGTHAFTPAKTRSYEEKVRAAAREAMEGRPPFAGPVTMCVFAFFGLRKGETKKSRAAKLAGEILPTKKPDCDNVLKCAADACNGIVYGDDAQITDAWICKAYADEPRVEIIVSVKDKTVEGE